ncbi:site-specific integrase [Streptomyces sp. ME02-8801-2C]|uniref:tyrosine-type recombinase/integrase n=1 Tax=Streptomyces sp. ME02-8801-2C TaxID=3028680 RepID=UPI0029A5A696|nr:site-specific integrase [Streptomyces sp. ME02-8801-2C]MDX3458434.1 site-specific integrase [Streptomyces sp. ME02-8801-2C]
MASKSIKKRPNGKWRARYRDLAGKEHARHFERKIDGERWLDEVTAALVTNTYVDPKDKKLTVDQWCDLWIESYAKRESTVRQARVHLAQIREEFGPLTLMAVDEMAVKRWMARLLREKVSQSYRFALHSRLSQVMRAAVRAKKLSANPCSRETSPGAGKQRPYVCTDAQLWQLYEAAEPKYRPALLLGAFAGLRTAEACGLRLVDVDLDVMTVTPTVQYPAVPLKTESSMAAVPIPDVFVGELKRLLDGRTDGWVLLDDDAVQLGPWKVERHMRRIRKQVPGLSPEFRFHDLRHYYASMLIASGADVKVVQQRLRHSKATTTLNTYGHLWPDSDQSTRAAVEVAMSPLINNSADPLRTARGSAEGTASSEPS